MEMWNDLPQAAAHGPGATSSARMHFLLDQLPPRHQLLWDNKLVVKWGRGAEGEWARVSLEMPPQNWEVLMG